MSEVSKGLGRIFQAFGKYGAKVLRAYFPGDLGKSAGDFYESMLGGVGDIFNPLPPDSALRPNDLNVTGLTEGTPIPFLGGPQPARTTGILVWVGNVSFDIIDASGGKGGAEFDPAQTVTKADCLLVLNDRIVGDVVEVRAGGLVIYRKDATLVVVSDDVSAVAGTTIGGKPELTVTSPTGTVGPDLQQFEVGKDVVFSGWAASGGANNGTWRVTKRTLDKGTGNTTLVVKDVSDTKSPVNESAGPTVTMTQALDDVKKAVEAVTILDGNAAQSVPTVITAEEGTGNAPAYRQRFCLLLERVRLEKVGLTLGNFEVFLKADASLTLAQAVDLIMDQRTTLASSKWDATALSGTVQGFSFDGDQTAAEMIAQLARAYDFVHRVRDDKIVFLHRGAGDDVVLGSEDVGAYAPDSDDAPLSSDDRPTFDDAPAQDEPAEVVVGFVDPSTGRQTGSVRQRRFGARADVVTRVSFDLTMDAGQARQIATRLLWGAADGARSARTTIPPSLLLLEVGDEVSETVSAGETQVQTVTRISEGSRSWVREVEGTRPTEGAFVVVAQPGDGQVFSQTANVTGHVFSLAPLVPEHVETFGVYVACARTDQTVPWQGVTLLKRVLADGGGFDWVPVMDLLDEAAVGRAKVVSALISTFTVGTFDLISTVDVEMISGALESVTEQEFLAGKNRLLVGSEVIGFQTATLVGTNVWRLSKLLRGLRDTQGTRDSLPVHVADEPVILLGVQAGVKFRPEPLVMSESDATLAYKLLPANGDVDDAEEHVVELNGAQLPTGGYVEAYTTLGRFRPMDVKLSVAFTTGTGGATLTWARRQRYPMDLLTGVQFGGIVDTNQYEVELFEDGVATADATYTVTGPSASIAWVSATFIDVVIYELSPEVGRGYPKRVRFAAGDIYGQE